MELITSGTASTLVASVGESAGTTFANISPVVAIPVGIVLAIGLAYFVYNLFARSLPKGGRRS